MLTQHQFSVLYSLLKQFGLTQRELADITKLSLGTINSEIQELRSRALVNDDLTLTAEGQP